MEVINSSALHVQPQNLDQNQYQSVNKRKMKHPGFMEHKIAIIMDSNCNSKKLFPNYVVYIPVDPQIGPTIWSEKRTYRTPARLTYIWVQMIWNRFPNTFCCKFE